MSGEPPTCSQEEPWQDPWPEAPLFTYERESDWWWIVPAAVAGGIGLLVLFFIFASVAMGCVP